MKSTSRPRRLSSAGAVPNPRDLIGYIALGSVPACAAPPPLTLAFAKSPINPCRI
jgi:hypothetical protein